MLLVASFFIIDTISILYINLFTIMQGSIKKTFLDLIAINSPYPEEHDVKEYIKKRLNQAKISHVDDSFGNIIAQIPGTGNPLMLNTHFDIPESTPNVDYEEQEDIIKATGNNILGADPKSGLAVLIDFACDIATQDSATHRPIDLVLTRGEEVGLLGSLNLDYSLVTAKEGLVLDQDGPVSEVVTKAPGFYKIDGSFIGKIVHPSEPQNGINAFAMMTESFSQVGWGFIDEGITWNVGTITGGTARNSVPGKVSFEAELRGFDMDKLKTTEQNITSIFEDIAYKYGGKYEGLHELMFSGYDLDTSDEFFTQLSNVLKRHNLQPNFITTFGGSDANIFNANGIKCVAIGSGYYLPHQYTEYIKISDLVQIYEVLKSFVEIK